MADDFIKTLKLFFYIQKSHFKTAFLSVGDALSNVVIRKPPLCACGALGRPAADPPERPGRRCFFQYITHLPGLPEAA